MAKFRPVAPARKDRRSSHPIKVNSVAMRAFSDELSLLTEGGDYSPRQAAHHEVDCRPDCKPELEDDVALPTPIAMLVTSDGREQPIYQPIPGFEHMFSVPNTQTTRSPTAAVEPHTPASTTESCTPDTAALKRRRSSAEEWTPKEPDNSGDDEEDETREVVKDKSYTFYIGDIEKLQRFMRQRFNELTMKPLRGIVTNWIRLLEPRRLGAYGKYHEMLPSQMPEDATPPWWPKTIIYKEPSHLKKHDLLTLAVEVMFIHRKIDEIKRRGSWVSRLRQIAVYAVETTAPDNFSSSKGSEHSEQMRQRALTAILPSLFEVAMSYEEHIVQHGLFEGSEKVDLGTGRHHTWQAIPRPARQPLHRKRMRCSKPYARRTSDCDGSADESSPDESRGALPAIQAQTPPQAMKVDSPYTPVERQQSLPVQRSLATPTSVFGQSMQVDESGEADVKYGTETRQVQPQVQPPCGMLPYNAYPACGSLETGFNGQMFQPVEQSVCAYSQAGLPFSQQSTAGYADQYPMYMTGYPPMGYGFGPTMPAMTEAEYGYGEYSMAESF